MSALKDFLAKYWGKIAAVGAAVIGVLFYLLNLKDGETDALKAQVATADTQKKSDLIESQINQKLAQKDLTQKQVDTLNQSLLDLQAKRKDIVASEKDKSSQQVEKYWNT